MSKKQKEKNEKSKLNPIDVICFAVLFVFGFIVYIFPESGEKVMLTNTLRLVFILLCILYAVIGVLRGSSFFNTRPKKVCQIVLIVCLVGAGALCFREHYRDLTNGTETIILYEAEVTARRGGGKYSSHTKYYVKGKDGKGEKQSFRISYSDYERLANEGAVIVEYYASSHSVLRAEAFPEYEFVPPEIDWPDFIAD